jgi:hypothetical protein
MLAKKRKIESNAGDAGQVCQSGNVNNLIKAFNSKGTGEDSGSSSRTATSPTVLEEEATPAGTEASSFMHTPLKNINDAKENRKGLEEHKTLIGELSNLRFVGGGTGFNQPPIQLVVGPPYDYTEFGANAGVALLHDFVVAHLDVNEKSTKFDAINAQATCKKDTIAHLEQVKAYFVEKCSKKDSELLTKLPVRL